MKKSIKYIVSILILIMATLCTQTFLCSIYSLYSNKTKFIETNSTFLKNQNAENDVENLALNGSQNSIINDNKQVYSVGKDEFQNDINHTIYWAKGITPPLMTSDENLLGTEGYFEKNYSKSINDFGYVSEILSYENKFEENKGYYDLNKNKDKMKYEKSYCYLCSASNLIYWWLEQNSIYIQEYVKQIMNDKFVPIEGLINIKDEQLWENLLKKPQMVMSHGIYSQEMTSSSLNETFKTTYIARDEGYWMDRVIDHFINGYIAISNDDQNIENNYKKDPLGGYFYQIFGKKRLSNRYTRVDYNFYNENLLKFIQQGKGLSMSYFTPTDAHAVTVWGVEYDENNKLKRIYVTDSDDFGQTTVKFPKNIRGLHSYEVKVDPNNNQIYFTTNIDKNAKIGSRLQTFVTLDLAQSTWEKKINDLTPPKKPLIEKEPQDSTYSINEIDFNNLEVKIKIEDTGLLNYQWYESDTDGGIGEKIDGATNAWYKPTNVSTTPKYYYCEIFNEKNGKVSEITKTRYVKVFKDSKITNAEIPVVSYVLNNGSTKFDYKQYENPKSLKVNATLKKTGNLTYQWYEKIGGTDYSPSGGTLIPGETSNIFYPKTNKFEDGLQHIYYCVVTNRDDSVNGKKEVSISPLQSYRITIIQERQFLEVLKPGISVQPIGDTYNSVNDVKELSVKAKSLDDGILSYKWFVNGNEIKGVNSPNYKPTNLINGTNYVYCEVTNTNTKASNSKTSVVTTNTAEIFINGEVVEQSSNNNLSSLDIGHNLTPTFRPDETSYKAEVEYSVSQITISATKADTKAQISGLGLKTLEVGTNTFEIKVTAENGNIKVYKIEVTKKVKPYVPSSNKNLRTLGVENYNIIPNFNPNVLNYTLEVDYLVNQIKIVGNAESEKATVNGLGVKQLIEGRNEFKVKVIAEDKSTKTYTITITKTKKPYIPSSNNDLLSLNVVNYNISPTFNKTILNYELTVENDVSKVTIQAVAFDSKSQIKGLGEKQLVEGLNICEIDVKAENGTVKTYTIKITRKEKVDPMDINNFLSELSVKGFKLDKPFDKNILEYTINVPYSTISIELLTKTESTTSRVVVENNENLEFGSNEINVKVISLKGEERIYKLNVIRASEKSDNNDLSSIIINGDNELPLFDKDKLEYEIEVPFECDELDIEGVVDALFGSKVEVSGNNNFKVGNDNVISITVTSEKGNSKTYSIKVTRKDKISNNDSNNNDSNEESKKIWIYIGIGIGSIIVICVIVTIFRSRKRYF